MPGEVLVLTIYQFCDVIVGPAKRAPGALFSKQGPRVRIAQVLLGAGLDAGRLQAEAAVATSALIDVLGNRNVPVCM